MEGESMEYKTEMNKYTIQLMTDTLIQTLDIYNKNKTASNRQKTSR